MCNDILWPASNYLWMYFFHLVIGWISQDNSVRNFALDYWNKHTRAIILSPISRINIQWKDYEQHSNYKLL